MDPDPPRKVKFAPKGPPRRPPKSNTAKIEADDDDDKDSDRDSKAQQQAALSRKLNEHLTRRGLRSEKKSSVQVAFSHGSASTAIRTFGKQREMTVDRTQSDAMDVEDSALDNRQMVVASTSTAGAGLVEASYGLTVKKKKDYIEPWDYHHSNYPTTLPLRPPFSGNPEILDKEEFEGAIEYDEDTINSALHLGLLEQDDAPKMIFFQFPDNLALGCRPTSKVVTNPKEASQSSRPSAASKGKEKVGTSIPNVSDGTKGKEIVGSSTNLGSGHRSKEVQGLERLPEGYMGKMLVYKSGVVKLKLGDILYDVSPGSDLICAQSVVAINTIETHCCELGELSKHAVVNPDTDYMVDHVIDLG